MTTRPGSYVRRLELEISGLRAEVAALRAENVVLVDALEVERNTSTALAGLAEANRRAAITAEARLVPGESPPKTGDE